VSIYSYSLFIFGVFASFLFLIRYVIQSSKKDAELSEKIKEARLENDIQKKYNQISSRPDVDANALLKRMRGTDSTE
jgi:cell division protein FtsX